MARMTHERKEKLESIINGSRDWIEEIEKMDVDTFNRLYHYMTKEEVITRKNSFIDGFVYALSCMGFHLKWKGTAHGGYEIVRNRR